MNIMVKREKQAIISTRFRLSKKWKKYANAVRRKKS